jgi:formylglycine-generating enzyme required for sulfatase activity
LVPGGTDTIGSLDFYPEEQPLRAVEVADLWMDEHPVTNAQFRRFVKDTGHVTNDDHHHPTAPPWLRHLDQAVTWARTMPQPHIVRLRDDGSAGAITGRVGYQNLRNRARTRTGW